MKWLVIVSWRGREAGGFSAHFSEGLWTLEVFEYAGRPILVVKKRLPESQWTVLSEVREAIVSVVYLPPQFLLLKPSSERG